MPTNLNMTHNILKTDKTEKKDKKNLDLVMNLQKSGAPF